MKKILIFTILLGLFMPVGVSYASELRLYESPNWTELEIAAERVGVEISRQRPIELEVYIEVLESYIEILKERIEEMGLAPVLSVQ